MMDKITRRAAIVGAAASSAALAIPAGAAINRSEPYGDRDAALLDLIEQWHEWRDRADNDPVFYTEIKDDPNLARMFEIEEAIWKVVPRTAQGLAAKLIVLSSYGQNALDEGEGRGIAYRDILGLCPAYIRDGEDGRRLKAELTAAEGGAA